jgi:acetone carboxylase gamma subunit
MSTAISATLEIREATAGKTICCRDCGYSLAPAGHSWKRSALVREMSTEPLGDAVEVGEAATILRLFVCPDCGGLLDSETALPGEPFLDDTVKV